MKLYRQSICIPEREKKRDRRESMEHCGEWEVVNHKTKSKTLSVNSKEHRERIRHTYIRRMSYFVRGSTPLENLQENALFMAHFIEREYASPSTIYIEKPRVPYLFSSLASRINSLSIFRSLLRNAGAALVKRVPISVVEKLLFYLPGTYYRYLHLSMDLRSFSFEINKSLP